MIHCSVPVDETQPRFWSVWGRYIFAGFLIAVVGVPAVAILAEGDTAKTEPKTLVAPDAKPLGRADIKLPDAPTPGDRRITKIVSLLARRDHLNRKTQPINDEISRRCLKTFLRTLDPMKVYFLQSDIDAFSERRDELDDSFKKGDIRFAYVVFKTFLKRIDERVAVVDKALEMEHDFTLDEEIIVDRKSTTYSKTAEEAADRWRRRIKYDLLVLRADDKDDEGQTAEESKQRLHRRYHSFAKRMRQTDGDELLEMYLTAMTKGLDPHTTYMSPKTRENFAIQMRLNLDGIGAALQYKDGYTVVSKIIPGGAADKEGHLKRDDQIVGVGQDTQGEIVDTVDMKLGDVVGMIRGKRGSIVRLEVLPGGKGERKIYQITRAKIELRDSEARGEIIERGKKADGSPYRLGVIDLPSFYMDMEAARLGKPDYKSTTRDVRKILNGFKEKKVDAVVLDLRMNGGGSLTESITLTGLFIDHGPVVYVKDGEGRVQHYDDLERGMEWEGPLAVVTSKFSASASEIFAGAIQDYGRGVIIGDSSTHGKGTVQSLLSLGRQLFPNLQNPPKLGALKITMQQFYRPGGDSTQNRGVTADVELPSVINHLDGIDEADLDYAVKFDRVTAVPFEKMSLIDKEMAQTLSARSAERRKTSEDFQKVAKRIKRYLQRKDRKTDSLNEKVFMAERAKDYENDDDKKKDDEDEKDPPVFKQDFYGNEVLDVTADYLTLLAARK
jgi:carboxyl-terminal processing protease